METPAAALMRRTEVPSWPYFFKQRSVASIRASRRTAGVARRNFGTGRFFCIKFPLFLIVPNPFLGFFKRTTTRRDKPDSLIQAHWLRLRASTDRHAR